MNEQSKHPNESDFSDEQMDGLLSSFFQNETPDQLKQLPSTWGAIQNDENTPDENTPTVVQQKSHSRHRRLLVIGSSLAAACLLMLAADVFFPASDVGSGATIVEEADNLESPLDQDATLNVSSEDNRRAIDDVNTSLEEIDMIDLSPQPNDDEKRLLDSKR
ncbi:MAG: hypothetical protein ABJZ55_03185 [Fuerstiella sp.]